VRIGKDDAKKHIVKIVTSQRDKDGKIKYETVETWDVHDATDNEVKEAVLRGLTTAQKK